MDLEAIESSQREHYNKFGESYDIHYSDRWALAYRDEFLSAPMFEGFDLRGKKVLDAMCGGGQLATFLEQQGAEVHGLDISDVQVSSMRKRHPGINTVQGSIFRMPYEDNSFDAVGICNALHHVHPHVDTAVREIHRVLKPGGCFGFSEPACGTILDVLRRIWYKFDPYFEDSEEAVDIPALKHTFQDCFEFRHEQHVGNLGYILVLNSMVLRIPASWKSAYSPAMLSGERFLNRVLPKFLSCATVCSWRKPLDCGNV